MTNSFCDVKISMMFTPDQRLMLFLRENDSTLGHLIYQKQVHTEEKNKSAQLLQAMFNKRHLNAKDIADIIGGQAPLKQKIEKIFDFLPKNLSNLFSRSF